MQVIGLSEDEKTAGIQRLSRRYYPSQGPEVIKSREDYKILKLTEAFRNIDVEQDGYITINELFDHITKKIREKTKDPTYQLTPGEEEKLKLFFDDLDQDGTGIVDM
jgi:Ca2+-binding EF-hand superfamily protein